MKTTLLHENTSRRCFLRTTVLAASSFTVIPSHILSGADAPSNKLNLAGIGVGGMGGHNLKQCAAENIVALCDVDQAYAAHAFQAYPKAKVYRDYREMLEKQKDLEAVIVATPDHTHAVIAMEAIRAGKHVYVQKPMTYSVHEARTLTEAARKQKVATQMGNQGHSGDGTRLVCEWIAAGVIGTVREVDAWTNRPVWPQGIEVGRPTETPPVPAGLDWDRWLGPAPFRPYHPAYVPGNWRAWCDFGTGSLGDLGCHILDAAFWAMKLKYPISVEGCISTYWHDLWKQTQPKNETFPRSTIVRYQFPARGALPPVKLTWWDGGMMPPRPDGLDPDEELGDKDGGLVFHGDKGILICGCYGRSPRVFPEAKMRDLPKTPQTLARVPEGIDGHEKDWVRACKGGGPASSNFDYSGPLTEMVLLGNLAVRCPNRKLLWDGENMLVTNDKASNEFVRRKYREGWTL
ncbi:MAG: Gfo/Idh/MocA family oxidoreductase [Verrucomicrobia bacterium]|nr:Gfo/Idh/MocA family oxidoreductase [Verrucomicrobiota bacterium]